MVQAGTGTESTAMRIRSGLLLGLSPAHPKGLGVFGMTTILLDQNLPDQSGNQSLLLGHSPTSSEGSGVLGNRLVNQSGPQPVDLMPLSVGASVPVLEADDERLIPDVVNLSSVRLILNGLSKELATVCSVMILFTTCRVCS